MINNRSPVNSDGSQLSSCTGLGKAKQHMSLTKTPQQEAGDGKGKKKPQDRSALPCVLAGATGTDTAGHL